MISRSQGHELGDAIREKEDQRRKLFREIEPELRDYVEGLMSAGEKLRTLLQDPETGDVLREVLCTFLEGDGFVQRVQDALKEEEGDFLPYDPSTEEKGCKMLAQQIVENSLQKVLGEERLQEE